MSEITLEKELVAANAIKLNYNEVKKSALVLRAINHKLRQRIMELVADQPNITVTEIYVQLRLEQSVASQHLAILRKAGVLRTNRNGKFINYSVDNDRIDQLNDIVKTILN
jgi:DNA-binding transcriptional ArsR family regulator